MNKKKIFIILMSLIILLTTIFSIHVYTEAKWDMWYIYSLALDSAINISPALNHEMKYIAIDTNSLKNMTPKDKFRIINYFESKYNVEVIEASYDELEKKGLVNEDSSIDGILLSVKSTKVILFNVYIEGSKFKAGLGAIGFKATVTYAGTNDWKLTQSKMTWIS